MDLRTEALALFLRDMATNIEILQSYLRAGHDLTPRELDEWCNAVEQHAIVYRSMILLLVPDPPPYERLH